MEVMNTQDLRYLLENAKQPSITIYLPTIPGDKDTNRILIKNAVSKARDAIKEKNYEEKDLEENLKAFAIMGEDLNFLNAQKEGLAVFINKGDLKTFRLPHAFEETVIVDNIFHIKPLLPVLTENIGYYVLAISKNIIQLYKANRYEIKPIDLPEMPTSMDNALQYDIDESHLGRRPSNVNGSKVGSSTHGENIGDETEKEFVLKYCQIVEKFISTHINSSNKTLILASVDYIQSIYKETSSYNNIAEKGISGNPDNMTMDQLRNHAWELIKPQLKIESAKAVNHYGDLSATERTVDSISQIVKAAHVQRIETLYLSKSAEPMLGIYDKENDRVNTDYAEPELVQDLIGVSVRQTLLSGGNIYYLDQSEMPGNKQIAALLRY